MNLKQINNLTELFSDQFNKQINKDKILLSTLGDKRKNYSWQETHNFINLVSNELRKVISKGDRCLLVSENRPEWFIADISIMLSDGITVPAYTTYAEKDYDYILNDCTPSIIFDNLNIFFGGQRESRTLTVLLLLDFESNASTSSAIRPFIFNFIEYK